jgi:hypothetical protein
MESRRFDQLSVSVATGSSRRRVLAGLGAIAMGTLLGRDGEAKPSGNKGRSGSNSSASCAADCAQKFKAKGKNCKKKDDKSDKKQCLRDAKAGQALCRQECEAAENTSASTETGSVPATGTGTNSGETGTGEELSILAKDLCTPDGTSCQDDLDASSPGNCLTATCTKSVSDGRYRCQYTRNTDVCTGEKHICCNYRRDAKNSGMCVAHVEQCKL